MADDWIPRIIGKESLAERLTQASIEKGIAQVETLIDRVLNDDAEGGPSSIFSDLELLRELQGSLKSLASSTYSLAKMGMLVPSGLWEAVVRRDCCSAQDPGRPRDGSSGSPRVRALRQRKLPSFRSR